MIENAGRRKKFAQYIIRYPREEETDIGKLLKEKKKKKICSEERIGTINGYLATSQYRLFNFSIR